MLNLTLIYIIPYVHLYIYQHSSQSYYFRHNKNDIPFNSSIMVKAVNLNVFFQFFLIKHTTTKELTLRSYVSLCSSNASGTE